MIDGTYLKKRIAIFTDRMEFSIQIFPLGGIEFPCLYGIEMLL
jgi:hypothetical protein